MKTKPSILITLALVPATVLVWTSCSSDDSAEGGTGAPVYQQSTTVEQEKGVPGGAVVDTYQITAKVADVDQDKRQYTLVTSDGKKSTFKAGPEVTNFDQVREGDVVKATVTEQLIVRAGPKGEARAGAEMSHVAVAPKGGKPGVVMTETSEVTARVKSVDLANHKATLEFPDGRTRTVAVRPDVQLSETDIGREVTFQATEAIAVRVEKP